MLHEADGSSELHAYVNYAHGDETLQDVRLRRFETAEAEGVENGV